MYTNVFARYVPVIRILMKKCRAGEVQHLNLNVSDFEKAGLARKTGVKFDLRLINGRPEKVVVAAPATSGFMEALQADETTAALLKENDYTFGFSNKYHLTIQCNNAVVTEPAASAAVAAE